MSRPSAFKTSEGEARFLAAYDAALKRWPVPYEEVDVPTRFGTTHVVVCGPRTAPPLVLLHGYMATSVMWSPNIADFSEAYRVYAIDTMGQPSKAGFTATAGEIDARPVLDLMYLGLKHFRIPPETLRVLPTLFLDHELRAMHVPTLLLIGEHEVIFEAAAALARARQLIPDVEGELVPCCRHDMCFSQHRLVDARVLGFLKKGHEPAEKEQRSIA